MEIPSLDTDRLILRAPCQDDFAVYEKFYADAEASSFYGGPLSSLQAWKKMAADIGHWHLRGYGMWSVTEKDTSKMVGGCGLVWPDGWPRSELTWWIIPSARRQGYAKEASITVIKFGYEVLGWKQVETHMDDDNVGARSLTEKLGGNIVDRISFPDGLDRNIYAFNRPA